MDKFDIVVIGAGPGGYVAAIKAAQCGKSVALIEEKDLGGTCLNVGCIPTKTLIANAEVYHAIKKAGEFGITTGDVSFDYAQMKKRKDQVIESSKRGLEGLIKSNGIEIIYGRATFTSPTTLKVSGKSPRELLAKKVIIATGSTTLDIPAFPCDHKQILNSTSILELTKLPKSLAVIGGGYIGCEFASLFAELGVKVTILEALPSIIAMQGKQLSEALTKAFVKQGIEIKTEVFVEKIDCAASHVTVHLKGGETVEAEMALVAVGRKVCSENLGLEQAGIATDDRGMIPVNSKMETGVPNVYAIGDVTGKAMLAHVASHQGVIAAANACGQSAYMHYHAVPAVIFTHPEIATVGLTYDEAKEQGYDAKAGAFPFQALGKAKAMIATDGFAQIVMDKRTKQILGAQAMGIEASTLIGEMAVAIHNELTIECLCDTIHAHPTLSESWLEAALITNDTPIHFPPKR